MKLFERQKIPRLTELIIDVPKLIKRKKGYHIILPISEDQKEGPTLILTYIDQAITSLRAIAEEINLSSISIAVSEYILDVPWKDIKIKFHTAFSGSNVRIIICKNIIKYPPEDIRKAILQEIHSTPVGDHREVTAEFAKTITGKI